MNHGHPSPPAGYPQMPPPAPQPPKRRGGVGVVLVAAAATLAAYLVAAGVLGALAYGAEPEEPEGTHALPEDPCAGVTHAQLRRVSAEYPEVSFSGDFTSSGTGSGEFNSATCGWYAVFSDGTRGYLSLTFRVPADDPKSEAEAEDDYESRSEDYDADADADTESDVDTGWPITVDESRELDLGDESLISFAEEGESPPQATATVLVRHANMSIRVHAAENTEADNEDRPDLTADEDLLIDIAEQALAGLA
ncbi:DUF3558 domain-containing protein [Allosalinactinospora lopnorensis]|uniref:hypothetical protein n=1 Tax=Allosalinactinospora lopnorensis TaxID=1352348 RepID=UPI000623F486|nr:hypothetical protein [Allosalinactinospora lopnorensis]